jgi:hypothetical protein
VYEYEPPPDKPEIADRLLLDWVNAQFNELARSANSILDY